MRELVGIDAGLDQGPCLFPDRIVAAHEDNAAPHQRRYGIVFSGEGSRRILIVRGIGRRCLLLDDQRIGPEPVARQLGEAILVPRRLIVEREKRRTMSHRHREEIRMFERPDLRIERIAHEVQPGACDVGIVPDLLGHRFVRENFRQSFVIPLLPAVQDHRHGLEIATAGCLRETLLQRFEMRGTGRRQGGFDGGCRGLGGCRRNTDRACGHGQSECFQCAPSSRDHVHRRLPVAAFRQIDRWRVF